MVKVYRTKNVNEIKPAPIDWDKTYTREEAEKLLDGATLIEGASVEGIIKRMMMTPEERKTLDCERD